jgi:hypothetical protein
MVMKASISWHPDWYSNIRHPISTFYTQAPLLPYAYGLWMKLFGISWFSARSYSATLTATLGLLIYEHVCRDTRSWIAGALLFWVTKRVAERPILQPGKDYWMPMATFRFGPSLVLPYLSAVQSSERRQ